MIVSVILSCWICMLAVGIIGVAFAVAIYESAMGDIR